jgi:hypothetical protein
MEGLFSQGLLLQAGAKGEARDRWVRYLDYGWRNKMGWGGVSGENNF